MAKPPPAPSAIFIVAGVVFVLLIGLAIFSGYTAYEYSSRISTYDSAKTCTSHTDLSSCRFNGAARIVHKWTDNHQYPRVDLAFEELGSGIVSATLYKSDTSQWQSWQEGAALDAELWHGQVTRVAGVRTFDNPDTLPNETGYLPAGVFAFAALACVALFVWLRRMDRTAD